MKRTSVEVFLVIACQYNNKLHNNFVRFARERNYLGCFPLLVLHIDIIHVLRQRMSIVSPLNACTL
jgi:hypothetical protein